MMQSSMQRSLWVEGAKEDLFHGPTLGSVNRFILCVFLGRFVTLILGRSVLHELYKRPNRDREGLASQSSS
jgi:hypothetical protein